VEGGLLEGGACGLHDNTQGKTVHGLLFAQGIGQFLGIAANSGQRIIHAISKESYPNPFGIGQLGIQPLNSYKVLSRLMPEDYASHFKVTCRSTVLTHIQYHRPLAGAQGKFPPVPTAIGLHLVKAGVFCRKHVGAHGARFQGVFRWLNLLGYDESYAEKALHLSAKTDHEFRVSSLRRKITIFSGYIAD